MTAVPAGVYDHLVQDQVDRLLAAHPNPFDAAQVTAERHWLPVERILAPDFRWPPGSAPAAWLDTTGLTWLHCQDGCQPPADLITRLKRLALPWFGLYGPRDGWLAVPISAFPATPQAPAHAPNVVAAES